MEDKLVTCEHCGSQLCYQHPINEYAFAYSCLGCGFSANDLLKEGEYDVEKFEETFPQLYIDLKYIDKEGRAWYPLYMQSEKGVAFVNGTSTENWTWSAILNRDLTKEEKQVYLKENKEVPSHKSDSTTMKHFGKQGFYEALDYIGMA